MKLFKRFFSPLISSKQSFYEHLIHRAHDCPSKVAFIFEGTSVTFGDLIAQSRQKAQFLERYIERGDVVAFHGEVSIEFLSYLLGVIELGGVYMPIPTNASPERKTSMAREAKPAIILNFEPNSPTLFDGFSTLCVTSTKLTLTHNEKGDPLNQSALYIAFSSGSTGEPKAIVGSSEGLLNRLKWYESAFPFNSQERLCQKASIAFVDHIAEIFQPIYSTQTCVILPRSTLIDIDKLSKEIAKQSITRITLVPTYLNLLTTVMKGDLRSLQIIISSGETLPVSLAEKIMSAFPWIRLVNIYGSSEVSADVTFFEYNQSISQNVFQELALDRTPKQNSLPLSECGVSQEEYADRVKGWFNQGVDVTQRNYLGHMTSPMPNYIPQLVATIAERNQNLVKIETSGFLTQMEVNSLTELHKEFYRKSERFYARLEENHSQCLGLFLNGGSIGNLQALKIASLNSLKLNGGDLEKEQKKGFNTLVKEMGYKGCVVISSPLAHYSIHKSLDYMGMGKESLIYTELNRQKMCTKSLHAILERCRKDKLFVIAVIGIAGTTECGSIDPLDEVATLCQSYATHFHVDAAWGGGMIFSSKILSHLKGIEKADSITVCAHKLLYTPQGLSFILYKTPEIGGLLTFHARYQALSGSRDLGQFSILGSKGAEALCLDANLKILGKKGLRYLVDKYCELANYLAYLIKSCPCFELIDNPESNIVNYRYLSLKHRMSLDEKGVTLDTKCLQQELFTRRKGFVSYTQITHIKPDTGVLRAVICNPLVDEKEIVDLLNQQIEVANELFAADDSYLPHPHFDDLVSVPIGYPISHAQVTILDDDENECLPGETGEICVEGPPVCLGYLSDIRKHTSPPKRIRTGDYGRVNPRGFIEFQGRQDRSVKINGMMIHLDYYESQIKTHPDIIDCKCETVDGRLVSFCITKLSHFPKYKMIDLPIIPHETILLKSFPKLLTGKIDSKALVKLYHEQKVNIPHHFDLITIAQSILGKKDLNLDQNLFEMGFDSLQINTLAKKLREIYRKPVSVANIFQHSTLNKLKSFLESNSPTISKRFSAITIRKQRSQSRSLNFL